MVHKLAKTETFFFQSHVLYNYCPIDGKPIIFLQGLNNGVHSIQDIMGPQGLHEFQDLQKST